MGRGCLEDLDIEGKLLKYAKERGVRLLAGFVWLMIGSTSVLL